MLTKTREVCQKQAIIGLGLAKEGGRRKELQQPRTDQAARPAVYDVTGDSWNLRTAHTKLNTVKLIIHTKGN